MDESDSVNVDWLGNPYSAGTYVVYGASGGRSINMVFGRVVRINETGTVTVQPLKSSRWKQHNEPSRYIDNRTGKGIDPYLDRHIVKEAHYIHDLTGREVPQGDRWGADSVWRKHSDKHTWVSTQFKDYVELVKLPIKPVTLTITENITVWNGNLPEGIDD